MPHKRNPVGSALSARVRAPGARAVATVLLGAMAQEHERAAGAWQAEWEALREALRADRRRGRRALREVLEGLEVDAERMRANLDATGGLLLAERVAAGRRALGRGPRRVVAAAQRASRRAPAARRARPERRARARRRELERRSTRGYLGSAEELVDARWRSTAASADA